MLCLSSPKVFSLYRNLFRSYVFFGQRTLPLPHPLLANWHQQWISCLLAHGQYFQKILGKTVNAFRKKYAPFCDRTFLFPNPLLANWHEPNLNELWGQERLTPLTYSYIHYQILASSGLKCGHGRVMKSLWAAYYWLFAGNKKKNTMQLFRMPTLLLPVRFPSLTSYFSPALLCSDDLLPPPHPPPAPSPLYLCLVCWAVTAISRMPQFWSPPSIMNERIRFVNHSKPRSPQCPRSGQWQLSEGMKASTDRCVKGSRANAPHVRTKESACPLVKDGQTKI